MVFDLQWTQLDIKFDETVVLIRSEPHSHHSSLIVAIIVEQGCPLLQVSSLLVNDLLVQFAELMGQGVVPLWLEYIWTS